MFELTRITIFDNFFPADTLISAVVFYVDPLQISCLKAPFFDVKKGCL